jgi:phospholipid/cholesterol/gamma-HCH transport system substrate-binding protein
VNRGREFLVGAVILASIAVGVGGTLWLQGRTFGPIVTADVLTESVGQLGEGNAVQYRGVRIGYVRTVNVLPDGTGVRVTIVMENEVALPSDPAVVFGPESLFGAWQAEVVSRSIYPTFPFYDIGGIPAPEEGSLLGGYALPELSRLSRSAEQISSSIERLTQRLEVAFTEEAAANISNAIANVQALTDEVRTFVRQQSEIASSITANADTALSEIQLAAGAARRTFQEVEGVVAGAGIDSILGNVRVASEGLRDITVALSDSTGGLGVTLEQLESTLAGLDSIVGRVQSGEGSFGRLLADSTFAVRAENVLEELDLLLADLRENPRRYVRLSIF